MVGTFEHVVRGLPSTVTHSKGEMLCRFLDQPEFACLFTTWTRGETYRQIRDDGGAA